MTLELTDRQAEELQVVLESYSRRLLDEIAHADDREFRRRLEDEFDRVEQMRRRLASALAGAQAYV